MSYKSKFLNITWRVKLEGLFKLRMSLAHSHSFPASAKEMQPFFRYFSGVLGDVCKSTRRYFVELLTPAAPYQISINTL